jgi:hypothetical protein
MPQPRKQKKRFEPPPPPDMLEIETGWQGDEVVYGLDGRAQRLIRERFPHANILRGVVIESEQEMDALGDNRSRWPEIAKLLTGLTAEQLAQLGGVRIIDPWPRKVLWEWKPAPAKPE